MLNCTESFVLDTRVDSLLFEEGVGVYDFNFVYEKMTKNVSKQEGKDLVFNPLPCKYSIFAFYLLLPTKK